METNQGVMVEARIAEESRAFEKPQAPGDRSQPSAEAIVEQIIEGLTKESSKPEILSRLSVFIAPLAKLPHLIQTAIFEDLKAKLGLRDKDLKAREKDIAQARKAGGGRGIPPTVESLEEVRRLHAAADIRNGYMTFGFRVNLSGGEIGYLLLISDGTKVRAEINPETVELGNQVYEVPTGAGVPYLEDVWSLKQVKAILESLVIDPIAFWKELKAALRKYLDLPEPAIGLIAAWIIMTYFSLMFAAVVFLHIFGPKECGKSESLESMGCLSFNAWKGKHISAAALGDTMEGMRGTMLIDQAENLPEELVGLLADSYKKAGGKRRIVDTSNGRSLLEFSTYGPKAFANTRELDPDLRDRCVRIPISRTRKPLPDLEGYEPIWNTLKDQLYRFALTHFVSVG
jgi:hypothetical protein